MLLLYSLVGKVTTNQMIIKGSGGLTIIKLLGAVAVRRRPSVVWMTVRLICRRTLFTLTGSNFTSTLLAHWPGPIAKLCQLINYPPCYGDIGKTLVDRYLLMTNSQRIFENFPDSQSNQLWTRFANRCARSLTTEVG